MRLVTYGGLVVRRVWAKRGALAGSFAGAAIVIALFVVVPLYEDSIKAIDLQFAISGTGIDETAVEMNASMTDFVLSDVVRNRTVVDENGMAFLLPWYTKSFEWVRSREFVVIPLTNATDWEADAYAWRQRKDEFADTNPGEVFEENIVYPRPPQEPLQFRTWSGVDIESRLTIVEGSWPDPIVQQTKGESVPVLGVVLGTDLARLANLDVGDRFYTRALTSVPESFALVEVGAIAEAVAPNDAYWGFSTPSRLVFYSLASFEAWMTGVPVNPEDDAWGRSSVGFSGADVNQHFRFDLDPATVAFEDVPALRSGLSQMRAVSSRDTKGDVSVETPIIGLLNRFDTRSVVVGAPIQGILALVIGGAVYFLVYTASITLEREGTELALLRSRGASAWQTVGIHVAQSAVVVGAATAIAPTLARALVAVTGRVPPMSELTGGAALGVTEAQELTRFLFAGAALAFIAMGLAIVPFARKSVLELRILTSRPTLKSVWQRYNLDLFAVGLSAVILVQLAQRGFLILDGDTVELDPVAIIFPTLVLFTGALLLLRILPAVLRVIGWTMARSSRLSLALPGWHLARNPVAYGRLALLVWLTSGLGAFALTYANTLNTSFEDRAVFTSGADVRIVGEHAGYLQLGDDFATTPVMRTTGGPRARGRSAQIIAIDPSTFAGVVGWRDDYSPTPRDELFGLLRPDDEMARVGIPLPEDTVSIRFEGMVQPQTVRQRETKQAASRDSATAVVIKVMDATGRLWTLSTTESLTDEGWSTVEIDFSTGLNLTSGKRRFLDPPVGPYELHTMWFELSDNRSGLKAKGDAVFIDSMTLVTSSGESPLDISQLGATNALVVGKDRPNASLLQAVYADIPNDFEIPTAAEQRQDKWFREGESDVFTAPIGRANSRTVPELRFRLQPLSVLVDQDVKSSAGLEVGVSVQMSAGGVDFPVVMVGEIDRVPTMTDNRFTGKIIFDQRPFVAYLNGAATWSIDRPLADVTGADELWAKTDDPDAVIRRATGLLGSGLDFVVTTRGTAADFAGRPVQIGLVAILFVGAVTSVVLALAGVVGYVLLAVSRRAREMGVLRAMGFPRRGVAMTFALEQVVVLGLGSVVGVFGGVQLMRLMVPFLQLGETATIVEPPVRLAVSIPVLLAYVGVVAALLVGAVLWATRRVSASRMSEVLREVER